jgi:hypothetical protein
MYEYNWIRIRIGTKTLTTKVQVFEKVNRKKLTEVGSGPDLDPYPLYGNVLPNRIEGVRNVRNYL